MKLIRRMVYASLFSGVFLVAQVFLLTSQTALTYATSTITGIAERIGYSQILDQGAIGLEKRNRALRTTVRGLSFKVATRTKRNVAASVASSFGEAVPYVGAGFVVASLTMDIMDGCSTMNDMNELMQTFSVEDDEQHIKKNREFSNTVNEVCATKVPSTEEVLQATEKSVDKASSSLKEGLTKAKTGWNQMTYSVGKSTYETAGVLSDKVTSWKDAIGLTSDKVSRKTVEIFDKAIQASSKLKDWWAN